MKSRGERSGGEHYSPGELETLATTNFDLAVQMSRSKLLLVCEALCNQNAATRQAMSPEDLCQLTILKALEAQKTKTASYRGEGLAAWLNTIAEHLLTNKLKSSDFKSSVKILNSWEVEEVADSAPDPETVLLKKEKKIRLKKFLETLNEHQKKIILLRMQGLKLKEIAETLNIQSSTVSEHIRRIKVKAKKSDIFQGLFSKDSDFEV